jgi:hypothetical protein
VLVGTFVVSRIGFYVAGGRFDMYSLSPSAADSVAWQVLDRHLLRSDLIGSIWYLHSQPPLFNLLCGLLLKLPTPAQRPVATAIYLALGLVLVLSAYLTMVALRVPAWLTMAVSVLIVLDPSNVLFENWMFYAYPTAAALSVGALCCVRYLQCRRNVWGIGLFGALSAVVMLDSSFQIVWILLVGAIVLVASKRQWRSVMTVAIVPLVVVGGWYVKDALQFGTLTTSSWYGMNLARTTLSQAPPAVIDHLVRNGTLSPLAKVEPFAPVSFYIPKFTRVGHTGHAVLDARFKALPPDTNILLRYANTNFNNLVYVEISRRYLRDDLAYIRAEPTRYLATVARAGTLWFVASDDYDFVQPNRSAIEAWARPYDLAVDWQPQRDQHIQLTSSRLIGPHAAQVSYGTVLVFLVALIGGPLAMWRRRDGDRAGATTLAVLWTTIVYAAVATSFVEFGENERFRFELGPLPLILAAGVVGTLFAARENQGRPISGP